LDRWDTATFAVRRTVADTGGNRGIASFRLGAGGRLAIGNVTNYKTLYIWNLDNRRVIKQIDLPTNAIPAIQPNGSLVSIPQQDDVALWDAATQQQVGTVPARHSASEGGWTYTTFSPDGRHLWTYGNGVTQLWNLASRSSVVTLTGAKYPSSAQFSPDGRYLATAAYSEIQIWDLAALLPSGG
jgi:WD40 repeat protein